MAWVVWPAAAVAEPPPAVSEDLSCRLREETLVERLQILIRRFVRTTAEEDREPYPPALELSFVEELAPGRVSIITAAARTFSAAKVAAARGSSWFSRKRTSPCW